MEFFNIQCRLDTYAITQNMYYNIGARDEKRRENRTEYGSKTEIEESYGTNLELGFSPYVAYKSEIINKAKDEIISKEIN